MEHPENDDLYRGLKVNKGVADVPTVNPYLKKRLQRKEYTPSEFVEGILKGNITILSQAVTLVESAKYEHQQLAQEIIEKCLPHAGKSVRIGITGVPGAGKSTSIDAFGMHLIKEGRKLAVLAIDPSSERSKGSILGDKTRMEALSREKNAFIRPSPSAGSLGGVARKTRETIVLCEAAASILYSLKQWVSDRVKRPYIQWSTSSCLSNWPEPGMNCKVSSAVSWKWRMVSSSIKRMAIISIKPNLQLHNSRTLCIFSRLPTQAGSRKC